MLVGYARCSTDQQDLTAQPDALTALGVTNRRCHPVLWSPNEIDFPLRLSKTGTFFAS